VIDSAEEFVLLRRSRDELEYRRAVHDWAEESVWMVPTAVLEALAMDSSEFVREGAAERLARRR
jgi:hypothetical protein